MKGKNVMRTTAVVMTVMMLSKLLGFVRQSMIASVYGADRTADIYFTASDFFIGAAGAFTAALITALVNVYIRTRMDKGNQEADRVASRMLSLYFVFGAAMVGLFCLLAKPLAHILAPSYDAAGIAQLARFLRIYSVAFIFAGFQSIFAAVLNANDSYVPGNLYGLIYNPLAIILMMLAGQKWGIYAVVAAYMIGNLLQLCALYGFCKGRVRFGVPKISPAVRQILAMSLPLLVSNILVQCNHVVDKILCNLLGEGTVSTYAYAFTLEQFITDAFTATVGLILYSRFSALAAAGDRKNMQKSFEKALCVLFLILLPVAVITIFGSRDIVGTVYMRGQFTEPDALKTQYALIGFAVGFPIVALREMYVRVHLAYQNSGLPMLAGLGAVALNAALSITTVLLGFGILGVSLATSVSQIFTIAVLNRTVRRYLPDFRLSALAGTFARSLAAGAGCALAVCGVRQLQMGHLPRFLLETAAGCGVYIAVLLVLRQDIKSLFKDIK